MTEIYDEETGEMDNPFNPRDGMSEQSAIFQIGKYANGKEYTIDEVENKGRYFTAKILNKNGKIINEIIVDKLNGRVKFVR